jgi:hypothetical protein
MLARRVHDLKGALGYIAKDSRVGYVTVKNNIFQTERSREWFHHRERHFSRQRQILIGMLGDLTKPEVCSASGPAKLVLQEARRTAKARGEFSCV